MIPGYTVEQVRRAEAALADELASGALMQRAAIGLATAAAGRLRAGARGRAYGATVLVLAGSGDNGGDALFAGARLASRGARVLAWFAADRHHQGGAAALHAAGGGTVQLDEVVRRLEAGEVDLVLDGILGIGGHGGLRGDAATVADALADADTDVVAVDLPSGLAADSPDVPEHSIRADATVTFGAHKLCALIQPAAARCGDVTLVDIGLQLPSPALRAWTVPDLAAAWPQPPASGDKYARGVVGIDAGSDTYPGAAVLSVTGAVFAGAGMVRYLGGPHAAATVVGELPNVVTAAGRVQATVLGSGWGKREDGDAVVSGAVGSGVPVVLDADALGHLPGRGRSRVGGRCLLTPHAGELARLLARERSEVEADPLGAVRTAVERTGATVLLKGATQYVLGPDDECVDLAVPGPAWTAQAGSGDVLGGICGALLAAGLTPRQAALAAASAQALAAADHPGPLPPQDLARRLRKTLLRHGIVR